MDNTEPSDRLFKAFLRFVIDALRDAANEPDEKIKLKKINRILDNLQRILED